MLKFLAVAVTALTLFSTSDHAFAKKASLPLCPGGRFVATDAPLIRGDVAVDAAAVLIAGGQVSIGGSCAATTAKTTRMRGSTLVRAHWPSCDGLSGTVRLRAVIAKGCATVTGTIRSRRRSRPFVAMRQPECGNGIREGQEPCDGEACCTSDCTRALDPSCPGAARCTSDADCASDSQGATFCARSAGSCGGEGVCQSKDVVCTADLAPVCGCDDKTYPNACEATRNGAGVATPGACTAASCGTIVGLVCHEGQVCELPAGECHTQDAEGRCVDLPQTCLGILDPVCGCDGNTYVNDCYRRQAGIQKARDGDCHCRDIFCSPGLKPVDTDGDGCLDACVDGCDDDCDCLHNPGLPPSQACPILCIRDASCGSFRVCEGHVCVEKCGPIPSDKCGPPSCASNEDCREGSYCATREAACGEPGVCAPRPAVCPEVFAPVCGCDGTTYGNACEAAGHGVGIVHQGRCECIPPPCAADLKPIDTNGDGCPDTCGRRCEQTCDCYQGPASEFSEQCPLACPDCGEFWACEEGLCREHCGRIPPGNDQCQVQGFCTTNVECADGEYCACGLGMCDGPGICIARPDVCTKELAPVCGCDGQTYANPCLAGAAGVRVAARGPCECHDVTCPDGTKGVDTDGDGCTDQCRQPCQTSCDCGPSPLARSVDICPLAALCPAPFCGEFWTCEGGFCVDHCGVIPLGQDVCSGGDAPRR